MWHPRVVLVRYLALLVIVLSTARCATDCRWLVQYDGYYNSAERSRIVQALCVQSVCVPSNKTSRLLLNDFDTIFVQDEEGLSVVQRRARQHARVKRFTLDQTISKQLLFRGAPMDNIRVHRHLEQKKLTQVLHAHVLWDMGIKGQGVKVAIFDTGLAGHHPHFRNVISRLDFADENTADDLVGHGTFVAGVIAGGSAKCAGLAPDADLYIYKVFNKDQLSFTSWFLDAFNHAIQTGVDVLNLSIGGPDFTDQPFIDKVWELTANGITLVSAIGNDGPVFGTLNNPADQLDAIGVGAVNWSGTVARYSSRGMSTWELPGGYGRMKPDLVTYGTGVFGSTPAGGCRQLSGAVALLLSAARHLRVDMNAGGLKQLLLASARRLQPTSTLFAQGHGLMDLVGAYELLKLYTPQASISPNYIDLTECPYFWPYCSQPLYEGALPVIFNLSILNGGSVHAQLTEAPEWHPYSTMDASALGARLQLAMHWSEHIWPYAGWLSVAIRVHNPHNKYTGVLSGHVLVKVQVNEHYVQSIELPIRVQVIPTPPTKYRILWDQFRQLNYPPSYVPRDDLLATKNPLDWHGDHPHTNMKPMYTHLRSLGYYIEVSGHPLTCIGHLADHYSVLLIVDPEEEYSDEELQYLQTQTRRGLNVLVFADWHNTTVMRKIGFYDDNTSKNLNRSWWEPAVAGSNVPALNRLLHNWGVQLGDTVLAGQAQLWGTRSLPYASGTHITHAPAHAWLLTVTLLYDQGAHLLAGGGNAPKRPVDRAQSVVFALVPPEIASAGYLSVYGDSSCLDAQSAAKDKDCFWLLVELLHVQQTSPANRSLNVLDWSALAFMHHPNEHLVSDTELNVPALEPNISAGFARMSRVVRAYNMDGTVQYEPAVCAQWKWTGSEAVLGTTAINRTLPGDLGTHFKLLSIAPGVDWPVQRFELQQQWHLPPMDPVENENMRMSSSFYTNDWRLYGFCFVCVFVLFLCFFFGRRMRRCRSRLMAGLGRHFRCL